MFSKFSVKKPVTITMMILIILLLGVVSLSKLSIDLLPSIELPISIVQTTYSGAGPQEIENLITKPLEQTLVTVQNIDTITSISNENSSLLIMQFNFGTNMDDTSLEIREKIDMIKGYLPEGTSAPLVIKMDPNSLPIMQIAISNEGDIYKTQKIAEDVIQPRIESIEGAASANVSGGLSQEVEIMLKEETMKGYGLNSNYISQIIQSENMNLPGGNVFKGSNELIVRTIGEFKTIEEIRNLNIPLQKGGTIRLRDVADVNLVNKEKSSITKLNGQDVVQISIMKQSDSNTVNVARQVNKEISKLKKEYPDLNIVTVFDQSEYINSSISSLIKSASYGGLLAIFILFAFLRSAKTTLIIALSIPISIITTFILLYFTGITLNMMTIGGLALGIGMLVDNSIVVLENIYRHRTLGLNKENASIVGSNEVSMAVTASTLTTIAVFIPIVFTEGLASTIFRDFAMTIVMSLVSSLIVALTLIPMLSSKLVTVKGIVSEEEQEKKHGPIVVTYKKMLSFSLRHRFITVVMGFVLFASSIFMVSKVGAEFFPATDQGQININVSLPAGAELKSTDDVLEKLQNSITEIPEVDMLFAQAGGDVGVGMSMGSSTNSGGITVVLKKLSLREKSTKQVSDEIREISKNIAGADISVSEATMMSMGVGGGAISINVKGDDIDTLRKITDDFKGIIEKIDGTREVTTSYENGIPEVQIIPDRLIASQYGLTSAQIGSGVRSTLSGSNITKFKLDGNEIDVRLKGDNIYGKSLSLMDMIPISTATGNTIPLSEVADIKVENGPISIRRENQTRVMNVSCSVLGRDIQSVSTDITKMLSEYEMPNNYAYVFGGETKQMQEAFSDLFLAMAMAILLVYMIIAAQFESLVQPLSVMFSVPLALSGGFIGLFITGLPLSVVGIIGFIILVGIVVNNAIVLIDYVNKRRGMGEDRTSAILKAGPIRIRPIFMTALTTILGLIPMAIGIGEGSELIQSMGVVVIGGLLLSTMLTLIFVPVMYSVFDDMSEFFKRKLGFNKTETIEEI